MSIINSGQLTAQEVILYNSTVMAGLENAVTAITDIWSEKVALIRPVVAEGSGTDPMSKKIPKTMVFPFSPATAQAEDLTEQDRPFHPLVRNSVKIDIKNYGTGYYVLRKDFYNDIYSTLAYVPKKLARAAMKAVDIQLARLLRNGKTTLDYTGTFAFSTTKPISVNGAVSGTYSNLYTSTALTSINVGSVVQDMMGRLNEDGLSLGLQPDTLIVPPTLYQAAQIAINMKNIVFSGTGGVGNLAPGQANNTAAVGDNWIAMSGQIKQIVVAPELIGTGSAPADRTTWYVAECLNEEHGGAAGLVVARDPGFEFLTNLSSSDWDVYTRNRFSWAIERYLGVGYGVTSFISRCEQ